MQKLKIEYVPIESIKPYEGNAKKHPQEQIDQIKKSIELMGFDDPIAVWKNGEIIEGHGRLIAAQQLGLEKVPIIRLDELSDEQRRAYILIHNKLTMNVYVNIIADHACVSARGAKSDGVTDVTSLRGLFFSNHVLREEVENKVQMYQG